MNNNTLPLLLLLLLSGTADCNSPCQTDNKTMLAMCLSLLLLFDTGENDRNTF
ncbi:MAG: hypothetical protein IJ676_05430 [Clostridia bacterium]|nr:hypothetical protein [Clostridia bacterium]